jgi:hypothetical protein
MGSRPCRLRLRLVFDKNELPYRRGGEQAPIRAGLKNPGAVVILFLFLLLFLKKSRKRMRKRGPLKSSNTLHVFSS